MIKILLTSSLIFFSIILTAQIAPFTNNLTVEGRISIRSSQPNLEFFDTESGLQEGLIQNFLKNMKIEAPYGEIIFRTGSSLGSPMDRVVIGGSNSNHTIKFLDDDGIVPGISFSPASDVLTIFNNSFSPFSSFETGNFNIGGITDNGVKLTVNGFTQLGGNFAPKIQMKKITDVTVNSDNGSKEISMGIEASQVLAIDILVSGVSTNMISIPPNVGILGQQYTFWLEPKSGANNDVIEIMNINGTEINNKPLTILITYEEG